MERGENYLALKKIIILIFIFLLNSIAYSQNIAGVYTPKKTLNVKNIIGKIPSYTFLQIKEDSTYYYETFWGSFELDNEYGSWKYSNDSLLLIPKFRFSDTITNYIEIEQIKNKSIKDGLGIRIMYSGYSLRNVKIKLSKDNDIREYITDENGYIVTDLIDLDYISIDNTNLQGFKTKNIHVKNDCNELILHLDIRYYIVKGKILLNFNKNIVAKRR